MSSRLVPQLVSCFQQGYSRNDLSRDLMSGIIVGIVALPLAIAFAIASGVKPEQGIFTAIIAGFLISALSGSRVQIGGPTGAFIVVVFGIVHQYGYGGLAVATMMAGALMVLMGLARLGAVIKFIPYPMTVGFTSGIALIIATTQLKDLLGLPIAEPAPDFIGKIGDCAAYLGKFSPHALLVGGLSLAIVLLWPRVTRKIPGSIIAIFASTALVQFFDLPVATIGSEFGSVPSLLPAPKLPVIDLAMIPDLISPALTIALLGAIESLLSAVVADGMTGTRHRSNMELVAQGVANLVTPLFGGIPATGAIARTATNVKNGGRTPIAGIVHALTLLLVLVCFGRWATLIPMSSLAAVLLLVAFHMSEWKHFVKLLRSPRADILVMLTTFALTVFVDLTVAIETGVVLSALLFMNRMAEATEVKHIKKELKEDFETEDHDGEIPADQIPDGVEIFEVYGPFFFGAANQFKDTLSIVERPPAVLILRLRHILTIDATALRALEDVLDKSIRDGTRLILSGVRAHPLATLRRAGLYDKIGAEFVREDIHKALNTARKTLGQGELHP